MGSGPWENGPERTGAAAWTQAQGTPPIRPAGGIVRTLAVQPWDVNPIPTAQNFYNQEAANLTLPGAKGSTVLTTVAGGGALQIPPQNVASIQAVVMFCDAPSLTTSILYTVRANGSAITGLQALRFPPQGANFINLPVPGPWNVVSAGAYIDVLITRTATDVPSLVNFTLVGWFCSPQDVQRWTGQVPGQVGG